MMTEKCSGLKGKECLGLQAKEWVFFKLRIDWLLGQFSIMMGLYGIISEQWCNMAPR
jgi:hypothetical protein